MTGSALVAFIAFRERDTVMLDVLSEGDHTNVENTFVATHELVQYEFELRPLPVNKPSRVRHGGMAVPVAAQANVKVHSWA